jgi:hypothetical protein
MFKWHGVVVFLNKATVVKLEYDTMLPNTAFDGLCNTNCIFLMYLSWVWLS